MRYLLKLIFMTCKRAVSNDVVEQPRVPGGSLIRSGSDPQSKMVVYPGKQLAMVGADSKDPAKQIARQYGKDLLILGE